MSTRQQHSEIVLAEFVCQKYQGRDVNVLVGGLGFGYTLKAVLDNVSQGSTVTVFELLRCVIDWNKDEQLQLAHRTLRDPRLRLVEGDVVYELQKATGLYDIILLDVDNGPEAFSVDSNDALYSHSGLVCIYESLRRNGTLAVWSAAAAPKFERLLRKAGFKVQTQTAKSRPNGKGATHTLFFANK